MLLDERTPEELPQPREEKKFTSNRIQRLAAPLYAVVYAELRVLATTHGYALAVHGSLSRDLDLVAIPWVEGCTEPDKLAEAFTEYLGGNYHPGTGHTREHGRRSYVIHFDEWRTPAKPGMYGEGPYIDLSIMPPYPKKDDKE